MPRLLSVCLTGSTMANSTIFVTWGQNTTNSERDKEQDCGCVGMKCIIVNYTGGGEPSCQPFITEEDHPKDKVRIMIIII